jgi:hypothetical protein
MAKAKVAADHPDNQGVLRYVASEGGFSIHPDVLDRMSALAAKVPGCDRVSVRGARLLVHRASGVIVACALGTDYFLRAAGVPRGVRVQWSLRWTDGGGLNVRRQFGPGWIIGQWHRGEADWIDAVVAGLVKDD